MALKLIKRVDELKEALRTTLCKKSNYEYKFEGNVDARYPIEEQYRIMKRLADKEGWYEMDLTNEELLIELNYMAYNVEDQKRKAWVVIDLKTGEFCHDVFLQHDIYPNDTRVFLCDIEPECLQHYLHGLLLYSELRVYDYDNNMEGKTMYVVSADDTNILMESTREAVWDSIKNNMRVEPWSRVCLGLIVGDIVKASKLIAKFKQQKYKNTEQFYKETRCEKMQDNGRYSLARVNIDGYVFRYYDYDSVKHGINYDEPKKWIHMVGGYLTREGCFYKYITRYVPKAYSVISGKYECDDRIFTDRGLETILKFRHNGTAYYMKGLEYNGYTITKRGLELQYLLNRSKAYLIKDNSGTLRIDEIQEVYTPDTRVNPYAVWKYKMIQEEEWDLPSWERAKKQTTEDETFYF